VTPGDCTTHLGRAVRATTPGCTAKERIVGSQATVDERPDLRMARGQSNMWYISAWVVVKRCRKNVPIPSFCRRQDESLGPARRDHMMDDTYVITFSFFPNCGLVVHLIVELIFLKTGIRILSRFDPDPPRQSSMEVATYPSHTGPRLLRRESMTLSINERTISLYPWSTYVHSRP
jgi:hypothetical protein